ncbi:RNA-dependent RNA polymerase [Wuhan Louse Fly Virus 5]|uniref:RNA-directed RNA polymerase L n=1 Tax=Wuhan Louse Fly Virus 5 TaxID=1608119 RepID=A0A0B5KRS0_9RHAB|nr:RNA-dependent RNA polymerase [Wuhan Louse Fly Virus 5]AJG39201.1 RNA-dependent RNA polymerase [Wuhan Louse Fly Virus 5]
MDLLDESDETQEINDQDFDLETSSSFELDEDEFELSDQIKYHYQNLNQNDYSLNSPLISDDLEGYLAHKQQRNYPLVFKQPDWEKRDKFFEKVEIDFSKIKKTDELHKWWGKLNQINYLNTNRAKSFLRNVISNHLETLPIVEAFFESWIGKKLNEKQKSFTLEYKEIEKWCELFLMMHDLILIMNANSKYEIKKLKKILKFKTVKTDHNIIGFKVPTHLGLCLITGKIMIFKDHNIMIDRLFALMMKDTWIARMNTLIGLVLRTEHNFDFKDIETIDEIYNLGDQMLEKIGNEAYDSIKMLEPMCNLRFCELAREFRPLIPPFPGFSNHIERSVNELQIMNPKISKLKEIIEKIDNVQLLLVVYGSFRHWGHPFIDYLLGLEALHTQVHLPKRIDENYAKLLGSDLAYLVLKKKFTEEKKWYVDLTKIEQNHPLYKHIQENTWPTPKQIEDFGDKWNELPLTKCFDIPDIIDPSLLYSDKSHSMNRDEVINHVSRYPNVPIPTKKVLDTLLHTKSTNWPVFLQEINDHGLPRNSKIIGLKGKEREVKKKGRFFSLMSWMLREYFVITEYLIKENYVPLFSGLTMADDLTTVISKLLDRSQGQGGKDYTNICIANHIDYEKWNNHQRKAATDPVFKVMGEFLGYPNLFTRTHEFFQESLIYYNGRPDLMRVNKDSLTNATNQIVCWEGQEGGLEGLRQKGWTTVGLLMIRREARVRNTTVKILAQGDNQVICTQYKLRPYQNEQELGGNLQDIWYNNHSIMNAIQNGTNKLGLIINEDETIQSADYLNYGKIPVFRGRILNLFSKRLSRIMCITNDQLLNYGNIMATVSTNALTVCHFDRSPHDGMIYFNLFGNLTRLMIERHNPVLGGPLNDFFPDKLNSTVYKILSLYLDPSLGGACGTSLTRFLTRAFPDPVTESLSFWKVIHQTLKDPILRQLCCEVGNPKIAVMSNVKDFIKLLEKPDSLNIPKSMSIANLLKAEIKKSMQLNVSTIKNEVISDAIIYLNQEEETLLNFLMSIKPLFPRFLSEFKSATFIGITENLIGLFQNSRTIRTAFSRKLYRDLNKLTWDCELSTFKALLEFRFKGNTMWECSASHADLLRKLSWGSKVLGSTVPHPIEMFKNVSESGSKCKYCKIRSDDYITCMVPKGLKDVEIERGPYTAYLGSRTSESTSILQPWDKETNISIIRRAVKLRNSIHWFVDENSILSEAILSIAQGLTGEDWSGKIKGFKRTGSALHRFSCSRQSSGGYAACCPTNLSWMISTTDTFRIIGNENFDFMFQPSLLYGQISASEMLRETKEPTIFHYHLSCDKCLRKIEEPTLDSKLKYKHPDVSKTLIKWKPDNSLWYTEKPTYEIKNVDLSELNEHEISFQVGRIGGFLLGNEILGDQDYLEGASLFPISIQFKIIGYDYLYGLFDGIVRSCLINVIHRRNMIYKDKAKATLLGTLIYLIDKIGENIFLINLCRKGEVHKELMIRPHKTPPTYPISDYDMGILIRNWLKTEAFNLDNNFRYESKFKKLCIFSDINGAEIIGPYCLSTLILQNFSGKIGKNYTKNLREVRSIASKVRSGELEIIQKRINNIAYKLNSEVRHACKFFKERILIKTNQFTWGKELICQTYSYKIHFVGLDFDLLDKRDLKINKKQCPLITGLRLAQLATGAHYKLRSIIYHFGIKYRDFLCGGDGSGGMTAYLLRHNSNSRGLYNSLLTFKDTSLRGTSPGWAPAIEMCTNDPSRCVNGFNSWEDPSDLSKEETWENFMYQIKKHQLNIDLIVLDMEIQNDDIKSNIERQILEKGINLLHTHGSIISKVYGSDLSKNLTDNIVRKIGKFFNEVYLCNTEFSGSHTSEMYAVFLNLKQKPDKNKYPEKDSFIYAIEQNFSLKSDEFEFDRALKLKEYDMLAGIPKELIPDKRIQMEGLLSYHGVETGLSYSLSELIINSIAKKEKQVDSIIGYIVVACNSIVSITRESLENWEIPSDGNLRKMFNILIGVSYWLSWCTTNLKLYQYLNYLIAKGIIIGITKITKKDKRKYVSWKVGGACHIAKKINLDTEMSSIGAWIRILSQVCKKGSNNWDYDVYSREFNKGLNRKKIQKRTGIEEVIKEYKISSGEGKILSDEIDETKEISWRS